MSGCVGAFLSEGQSALFRGIARFVANEVCVLRIAIDSRVRVVLLSVASLEGGRTMTGWCYEGSGLRAPC